MKFRLVGNLKFNKSNQYMIIIMLARICTSNKISNILIGHILKINKPTTLGQLYTFFNEQYVRSKTTPTRLPSSITTVFRSCYKLCDNKLLIM